MKYRRVRSLVIKEALQAYKEPSSIITAFVFPLILLFLYGYGVSLDMDGIRIAVVAEDTGPLARGFVRSLMATRYLETRAVGDRNRAEQMLTAGAVDGIVVIPSYFSKDYENPERTAPIQVIADGSAPNTAQFVQNYIRGVWFKWRQERSIEDAVKQRGVVTVIPRVWYNEELLSVYFLIPGSIVVIMTVTGALLTSLVIAREWERGTMEALMATPVSMGEIVISKLVTYFFLGVGAMILSFIVAHYFYQVPFRGSYLALTVTSLTYLVFTLGMGLLVSISVHDQFAASQIVIVTTYLPAFILSGFIFDISSMPLYLRTLTYLLPARYFVDSLKTLFLVGDILSVLLPNILVTGGFSLVIFMLIRKKCVKKIG